MNEYDTVLQLASRPVGGMERRRLLSDFAYALGWRPSDRTDGLFVNDLASAHLVVEHGLQNTAVISFLRESRTYEGFTTQDKRRLLSISYNNLVEWHIQVEPGRVAFVFNLSDPPDPVEVCQFSRESTGNLRSEVFQRIAERRPSAQWLALDDALIETISFWKRNLSAEMGYVLPNESLSALFNSIMFARAVEDHHREMALQGGGPPDTTRWLIEHWGANAATLCDTLLASLAHFVGSGIPSYLVDETHLRKFDDLDRGTVFALLHDFYRNRYAPYEFDFSLMSKHALSRIYEHYVSLLRVEDSVQAALPTLPSLPEEDFSRTYGSVYTPQFIARFFARYLREQIPPAAFRRIHIADPACGSGIFLRTVLETQCDPAWDSVRTDVIDRAFGNLLGLDLDQNACQATRLSLALLHLTLTGELPSQLNVHARESIEYFEAHQELRAVFDAVIANPPFVSLDAQSLGMRRLVKEFMGPHARGRIDMYLPFLRMGLEMLKPGGYGLFVLPHSFLLGENAQGMRGLIAKSAWIRCLADLSAIRVFGDSGSYIILMVFQKRLEGETSGPPATIVRCRDLVGRALQDAAEGVRTQTAAYSIHDIDQQAFGEDEWVLLSPAESRLRDKFRRLPTISDFLEVRQGFVSGADDVYIVPEHRVPQGEEELFVPFLGDRDIDAYTLPADTGRYVFYPYLDNVKLDEATLRDRYPITWAYLSRNRRKLASRGSLRRYKKSWWEPMWPRPPSRMMRPKIVTPHLVIVPRFSLDAGGRYAVSHAPLMYPRQTGAEEDLLRFFLAVLNSTTCFWYISSHSHVYRGGYVMLEPKTLKRTPIPDPSTTDWQTKLKLLELVDERVSAEGPAAREIEGNIDDLVAGLYALSSWERRALGVEA
jgi:hypothetical protein